MNAIKARDLAWKALLRQIKDVATQGECILYVSGYLTSQVKAELINLGYRVEVSEPSRNLLGTVLTYAHTRISW